MSQPELSPEVLAFLGKHISTPEQFELLARLVETPDRWWDATAAARDLGISEREAHSTLDHLAKQNLLDIRITADVRYQFRPGTEPLRAAAVASLEAFRRRPIKVFEAIAGQRPRRGGVRDFADAFRIRRHDDR